MKARKLMVGAAALLIPVAVFASEGQSIFDKNCKVCHGPAGDASTPMAKTMKIKPLSSPDVQKQSKADLVKTVTDGKGKMQPFGKKLTAAQISDVVDYIKTLKK